MHFDFLEHSRNLVENGPFCQGGFIYIVYFYLFGMVRNRFRVSFGRFGTVRNRVRVSFGRFGTVRNRVKVSFGKILFFQCCHP